MDSRGDQRIRQAIRLLLQIPERQRVTRAVLVFPVKRKARSVVRPAPAAGVRDVEIRGNVPAVRGVYFGVAIDAHAPSIEASPRLSRKERFRLRRADRFDWTV